jgi:hypothetical protein
LLLLYPAAVPAAPAITCHCFTDRSYDPARPALADPYFLATTQNSFFAAVFGVDKKTIVMKKQSGVSADDLWVAYALATSSGADPETLLQARKTRGNWHQVATSSGVAGKNPGRHFAAALQQKAVDGQLADAVVDDLLLRFRFYGDTELSALRRAGAGNQELILSGMLALKGRQPAAQLYRDVKRGSVSWGGLLQRAGISPADIPNEMNALLKSTR